MTPLRLIVDTHHSPTPSTPHQAAEQSAASACGLPRSGIHVGVLGKHLLVLFELLPTDVAGMMVVNQHTPLLKRFVVPMRLTGPPAHDRRTVGGSAKHIGTGVDGTMQHFQKIVISGRLPLDPCVIGLLLDHRQLELLPVQPLHQLAHASQLTELPEYQTNSLADSLVWIHLDLAQFIPTVPGGQQKLEFSALGLGLASDQASL